ncbi:MAG: N-acetyltransferase [Calditrichaeota bacterium]|nr:MAG: N-acetyltransferase [Calditrichota bacterium]MBL1204330.1 N-acetyltransferase [Calditrichota bacterium]NOG44159.1 GNAT family N-acetyltransferase [Calditrichota bacterium]
MKNPFIIGTNIYLRACEDDDKNIWAETENHPDPREFLFYALPSSPAEQLVKLEQAIADHKTVLFTICEKESDKSIGVTAFYRVDWISRAAVYYIAIAQKENWSKGYGREVTNLMIDYAFETLNLNRIQLHVYVGNERAVKAYQKCGFKIEGTLREAMFHKGHYCDFYVMGLLSSEKK